MQMGGFLAHLRERHVSDHRSIGCGASVASGTSRILVVHLNTVTVEPPIHALQIPGLAQKVEESRQPVLIDGLLDSILRSSTTSLTI